MFAKKYDLALFASSASAFACLKASSACFRTVMSARMAIYWRGLPFSPAKESMVVSTR